jgi:hypothetical protein
MPLELLLVVSQVPGTARGLQMRLLLLASCTAALQTPLE